MPSQANLAIDWRAGYGPIAHQSETIERMQTLVHRMVAQGRVADEASAHALLAAADRVACMAPDGQCKFPHPWPPQIPPGRTPGL